jgi:hypothetical protein
METADRIVQAAYHLFIKFGIRSITMDDVARELSVPKKPCTVVLKTKTSWLVSPLRGTLRT